MISSRVLLDTGERNVNEYIGILKKVVDEHQIQLDRIIISHWHHDHVGGVLNIINDLQLKSKLIILFNSIYNIDSFRLSYSEAS